MKANKLSCKDVMVGDWVDVRNDAAPNTTHLERITPSHFLRDEHWYGVELVPEILEKNGFVLDDEWYAYTGQGVNIDVAFRDDNKFVYDLSILTGSGSMDIHAKYVHELQHALRLCGITHEIIL